MPRGAGGLAGWSRTQTPRRSCGGSLRSGYLTTAQRVSTVARHAQQGPRGLRQKRMLPHWAPSAPAFAGKRVSMSQTWHVDIRVKAFVLEAASRLDFLCTEYGFMGPEVVPGETGVYPLRRRVRYTRSGLAVEISLVLSYMGEEHVAADLVSEDDSGAIRRTPIGSVTAHTGYQMRRALDRQAAAVRAVLRDRIQPPMG
jgi:hypothetical protein